MQQGDRERSTRTFCMLPFASPLPGSTSLPDVASILPFIHPALLLEELRPSLCSVAAMLATPQKTLI